MSGSNAYFLTILTGIWVGSVVKSVVEGYAPDEVIELQFLGFIILACVYIFRWRRNRRRADEASRELVKPVPSSRKAMEESHYQPPKSTWPGVVLVCLSGSMQGRQFAMEKEIFRIGANPDNDLVISGDDYASGKHACLRHHKGNLLLTDQQSKNGTFVNDHRLTNVPLLINMGDQIRVGNSTFQVSQARHHRMNL